MKLKTGQNRLEKLKIKNLQLIKIKFMNEQEKLPIANLKSVIEHTINIEIGEERKMGC